ncbi:hypothetical protein RhiirA4_480031 [Rhizophagus irregularis]|uniref:Uncharacterized protein n=1 Tax=Rhizophagus irregularis TaxID=588596 RepID=A0A2I1HHA6_9GLOM|nr:hypothetical protein RhiirA4_480031 [Rhizophagus irregularis]
MWLSTHTHNGEAVRRIIIEQNCNVKFIKFISYDLVVCPYIALVCIGTHNHPPSPPERTPSGITGNSIKDKDELAEIHIYAQAKGLCLALAKRDPSKDWETCLTNLIAKKFDHEVYQLELSIPPNFSAEEVYNCLK